MPRAMHLLLPVSIELPVKDAQDAAGRKKHRQIKGRPRRVEYGSTVVKCSVKRRKFAQLDRLRAHYDATMPEIIRLAVERFVERYGNGEGLIPPETKEKRQPASERCHYIKVPLPSSQAEALESLAPKLGLLNRQSVVDRAIDDFIARKK